MYGIRPHLPPRPGWNTISMEFPVNPVNRPAMELMFDLCLKCVHRPAECTCYDDGKGLE